MSNAVDETSYRVDGVTYRKGVMSKAEDETSHRVDGVTYRKGVMSKAEDETSHRVDGVTYREDVMSNATDKTSYRAGQVLFLSLMPLHKIQEAFGSVGCKSCTPCSFFPSSVGAPAASDSKHYKNAKDHTDDIT